MSDWQVTVPENIVSETEITLKDLQSRSFLRCADTESLSTLSSDVADVEKTKHEVKSLTEISTSKLLFYKFLSQDQGEWPVEDAADNSLAKASEELKESIEKEKEKLNELSEEAIEGYNKLQSSITELTTKLNLLKEKIAKLSDIKNKQEEIWAKYIEKPPKGVTLQQLKDKKADKIQSVLACLQACNENVESVKKELSTLQQKAADFESRRGRMHNNIDRLGNEVTALVKQHCINLKKLISDHEDLSGIKEHTGGDDQIILEFINSDGQQDDPQLILTINFEEDTLGTIQIKSAQVNIDSVEVSDIIQTGIEFDDIRLMIQKLKQRWLTHFPLAVEMKIVAEHHAVDWMQEEGLLRVLVGKGGCIICTLQMPKTYPTSGDITLVDAHGLPEGVNKNDVIPPVGRRTIRGWVDYLESTFGRP